GDANAGEFVERYLEMIAPVLRGYSAENKHFTTLAIGCTGGKHRSVAVAEKIGDELRRTGSAVRIRPRELRRECAPPPAPVDVACAARTAPPARGADGAAIPSGRCAWSRSAAGTASPPTCARCACWPTTSRLWS